MAWHGTSQAAWAPPHELRSKYPIHNVQPYPASCATAHIIFSPKKPSLDMLSFRDHDLSSPSSVRTPHLVPQKLHRSRWKLFAMFVGVWWRSAKSRRFWMVNEARMLLPISSRAMQRETALRGLAVSHFFLHPSHGRRSGTAVISL